MPEALANLATATVTTVTEHAKNNLDVFNAFWQRLCRAITAGAGVVVAIGKFPSNEVEWAGMVIALLGGSYTTRTRGGA